MKREPFDEMMASALKEEGKKVSLSSRKQEEILEEIHKIKEKEERGNMIRIKPMKKVILTAAAMCIFAAFGVMAAGKITVLQSSVKPDEITYTKFAQVLEDEKTKELQPYGKESYENGMTFARGYLTDVEGMDESGNVVGVHPELMMYYENGKKEVLVTAQKPFDTETAEGNVVRKEEYKGLELTYEENKYLFVPGDYELSDELKESQEAGEITISYGLPPQEDGTPAEPEEETMYSISWQDGGISHMILSTGEEPVMGDSLVAMAKETIDAKEE